MTKDEVIDQIAEIFATDPEEALFLAQNENIPGEVLIEAGEALFAEADFGPYLMCGIIAGMLLERKSNS